MATSNTSGLGASKKKRRFEFNEEARLNLLPEFQLIANAARCSDESRSTGRRSLVGCSYSSLRRAREIAYEALNVWSKERKMPKASANFFLEHDENFSICQKFGIHDLVQVSANSEGSAGFLPEVGMCTSSSSWTSKLNGLNSYFCSPTMLNVMTKG
jgi:hypothetical protein